MTQNCQYCIYTGECSIRDYQLSYSCRHNIFNKESDWAIFQVTDLSPIGLGGLYGSTPVTHYIAHLGIGELLWLEVLPNTHRHTYRHRHRHTHTHIQTQTQTHTHTHTHHQYLYTMHTCGHVYSPVLYS